MNCLSTKELFIDKELNIEPSLFRYYSVKKLSFLCLTFSMNLCGLKLHTKSWLIYYFYG